MNYVTKTNKPKKDAEPGKRIKYLRSNQLMTQGELAEKLGKTRSEITMWETGDRTFDNISLKQMAQLFNVSSDYILGLTEFENGEINNREINRITGLSDGAINNLININKYHNGAFLPTINYLLEQEKMFPDEYYKQIEQTERTKKDNEKLSREAKEWKEKNYKRIFALIESYFNVKIEDDEKIYITNNSLKNENEIDLQEFRTAKEVISTKDIADTYLLDKIKDTLKEAKAQYLEEQTRNEE